LQTGAKHEFDAVSEDRTIVVSIKSASGLTSGGNLPQGKFHNAIAELYFLSLVDAPIRTLLITNPDFFALLRKRTNQLLPKGVALECLPLKSELQTLLDTVIRAASKEVSPQAIEAAVEGELD
jgi:hypothetical protein